MLVVRKIMHKKKSKTAWAGINNCYRKWRTRWCWCSYSVKNLIYANSAILPKNWFPLIVIFEILKLWQIEFLFSFPLINSICTIICTIYMRSFKQICAPNYGPKFHNASTIWIKHYFLFCKLWFYSYKVLAFYLDILLSYFF